MATEIILFDYRYIILDDQPSAAASVLSAFSESGVNLLAFSEFPHSPGKAQLDLIAEDTEGLARAAARIGLALSPKKTGFLIRGEDRPGMAMVDVLKRLAAANLKVTSWQALAAGAGRFGALLWVHPRDIQNAAKVLGANVYLHDLVDETSEESFPASDSPSWAMAGGGPVVTR